MDYNDVIYEPMDIDISSSSTDNMDISYNDLNLSVKQEKRESNEYDNFNSTKIKPLDCLNKEVHQQSNGGNIKKYHIKMVKRNDNTEPFLRVKIFSVFIIVFISVVFHFIITLKCSELFYFNNIKENLSQNVYGQARAIDTIMETLAMNVSSKILFLYGGTGVGKTFTTSLLLKESWNSSNVYHYLMPSFVNTFSSDFMLGLTLCKSSVLVVDDLTRNDMHIKTQIKDVITKSENLTKNITIILIFNCEIITKDFVKKCDESFYGELVENFRDIKAVKRFIKFDTLTDQHLRKCIERELGSTKVHAHEMDNILKNFNVSLDGCKGVYNKIKFLFYN